MVKVVLSPEDVRAIRVASNQKTVTAGIREMIRMHQDMDLVLERAHIEHNILKRLEAIDAKLEELANNCPFRADSKPNADYRLTTPQVDPCKDCAINPILEALRATSEATREDTGGGGE